MLDTSQELFDIVDENDQPLGVTAPRDQVHKDLKEWHRVTGIWFLNSNNQLLCQQRSFKKDVHPGEWQLTFGGHVKAGETYQQNIVLEVHEELGLQIKEDQLIYLGKTKNELQKHHAKVPMNLTHVRKFDV